MRDGGRGVRLRNPPNPARALHPARVLLITPPGSYRVHAYLEAARDLGVEMLVASEGEHSLVPGTTHGLQVDFADAEAVVGRIVSAHRERPIAAVVATDDATVEIANHAAAALGFVHNAPSAARLTRRKDLARAALAAAGLPVPAARRVDLRRALALQLGEIPFPCVVKPLAMSASRGVIRADDLPGLEAACRRAGAIAAVAASADAEERDTLLVESFVPGPEIALEGMLTGGELTVLAIFDKPDPLDGPFFEETLYVTPSRLPQSVQAVVTERVREGCAAYGLTEGPIHAELRIHTGDAWIIEIAGRTIGGDCARLFTFGTGSGLEHLVLRRALGRPFDAPLRGAGQAAGVLMIPTPGAGVLRRVEGVMAASRIPGVCEVSIAVREGYALTPLPEGGSYLGFVFARGEDPAGVEASLRRAQDTIRVIVAPSLALEVAR